MSADSAAPNKRREELAEYFSQVLLNTATIKCQKDCGLYQNCTEVELCNSEWWIVFPK